MTKNQQPSSGKPADRSENLLPPGGEDDGRYDVAEEVNLDEQSDAARRVGQAPAGDEDGEDSEYVRPSRPS